MNHPFAKYCQDIKALSSPLSKIGIDYFSFTRVYKTGQRVALLSDPRAFEYNHKNNNYLKCINETHPDNYQPNEIMLWTALPNQELYAGARSAFGAKHGIYLSEKKEEYYDCFGFATCHKNEIIINSYFNNLENLKKYISYFHQEAAPLIKEAFQKKHIMPFGHNMPISRYFSEELERKFSNKNINYKFSRRQLECIDLLIKGFTAKEIANHLHLSFRTVEAYIELLKKKLNCKNKTELVIRLFQYGSN